MHNYNAEFDTSWFGSEEEKYTCADCGGNYQKGEMLEHKWVCPICKKLVVVTDPNDNRLACNKIKASEIERDMYLFYNDHFYEVLSNTPGRNNQRLINLQGYGQLKLSNDDYCNVDL